MWRKTFVRHRITVPYKFPLGAITSMVKPFDCDDLKKYYFANFYPTPGVTTVQYLTTSLQSSKLLGRTLGLKYNHKSLHKSQFIVIYIRYIAELANVTFVQDVHDNISSGNGTSSKMLHHMIEVTYFFCNQNKTSYNTFSVGQRSFDCFVRVLQRRLPDV